MRYSIRLFITVFVVLMSSTLSCAQDPKDIIRKAVYKCESIHHGYYQMTETTKVSNSPDSTKRRVNYHFKKLPQDKLYGFAWAMSWPGMDLNTIVYTGTEMVYVYPSTRTSRILAVDKWAGNIEASKSTFNFYNPLSTLDHKPLPTLKQLDTPYYTYEFSGTAKIKNKPCHIVTVHINPDSINSEGLLFSKSDLRFWISDKDSLVLQYDMNYSMLMGRDSLHQYQKLSLDTFSLNKPGEVKALTMDGIPADILMEEYIVENGPPLLKQNETAPLWKLASLSEDSVALNDLRGNLVLVNFFFKNCYPATRVMPELQSLNEKYYAKGLRVIGIDPYDLKNEELLAMPGRLGVKFPILYYGKKVAGDYHVGSYPTMYLIDQHGKIISSFVGYNNKLKSQLEKTILANL